MAQCHPYLKSPYFSHEPVYREHGVEHNISFGHKRGFEHSSVIAANKGHEDVRLWIKKEEHIQYVHYFFFDKLATLGPKWNHKWDIISGTRRYRSMKRPNWFLTAAAPWVSSSDGAYGVFLIRSRKQWFGFWPRCSIRLILSCRWINI